MVLAAGESDASFKLADIALGQPDVRDCLDSSKLKWLEVTSAGYTRYDTTDFFSIFRSRNCSLTNASSVFADPCAQHVLAMMLALARQILPSHQDQLTDHAWHYNERRYHSRLITGQTVLLLGYGAIGRRLTELLAPFKVRLCAYRRSSEGAPGVEMVAEADLREAFASADHLVNILPANVSTQRFMTAERFSWLRPSAQFYNVGRGSTVDQVALVDALRSGRLAAAYLDVMEPEPLPMEHELWTAPNCFITPHTAGGRHDQDEALITHFLENLARFERGQKLIDRVI
jgi:phosphoglycerate dehydrogenase-like enzyme